MISEQDKSAIMRLAREYGVRRVLVFGSAASASAEARDIDLAVEGVRPADFFTFYGDLIFSVSKPVDLVDLSPDTRFTRLVRKEGIAIYG